MPVKDSAGSAVAVAAALASVVAQLSKLKRGREPTTR